MTRRLQLAAFALTVLLALALMAAPAFGGAW